MSVSIHGCCVCCPTGEKLMTAIRRRAPVGHFRALRSVAECVEGTRDLRRFNNFRESIRQHSDRIAEMWSPFSVWDSARQQVASFDLNIKMNQWNPLWITEQGEKKKNPNQDTERSQNPSSSGQFEHEFILSSYLKISLSLSLSF